MKKFFTLLAAAVLTCSAAWAETLTIAWDDMAISTHANASTAGTITPANTNVTAPMGTVGSDLTANSTVTSSNGVDGVTKLYRYKMADGSGNTSENQYFQYAYEIATGYKFTPSTITIGWCPSGSKAVAMEVYGVKADDTEILLGKCTTTLDKQYTTTTIDLSAEQKEAGITKIKLYPYVNKSGCSVVLNSVVVEGDLSVVKVVESTASGLTSVSVNGTDITMDELNELTTNMSLILSESCAIEPTIVFYETTTTYYTDSSSEETVNEIVAPVESDASYFFASATIAEVEYTVYVPRDLTPTLVVAPTAVTLASPSYEAGTASFNVAGANLAGSEVTISLPAVDGLTSDVATLPIEGGAVNGTVTLSYCSLEEVGEANAVVTVSDGETSATVDVTYSSTAAITTIETISDNATWDWTSANSTNPEIKLTNGFGRNVNLTLSNWTGWSASFNAAAIIGNGEYMIRENKYFQGGSLMFRTDCPGTVTVLFSNTGNRADGSNLERSVMVNGTKFDDAGTLSASFPAAATVSAKVAAGDVIIKGYMVADGTDQYVRVKTVTFTKDTSGIENISTENAAAVYYNLQGVRVDNPANGNVYIRVAGGKAEKVLVK